MGTDPTAIGLARALAKDNIPVGPVVVKALLNIIDELNRKLELIEEDKEYQ